VPIDQADERRLSRISERSHKAARLCLSRAKSHFPELLHSTARLGWIERRENAGLPRRQHHLAGVGLGYFRRFVPVTTISISRLPHLQQTSRLRQSGTVVSAPR
jgi:hypothetical protein